MRSCEFLNEGKSMPIICVDVQPEYANYGNNSIICEEIIKFVAQKQTGPVLMFVNAEDSGVSSDSIRDIKQYWENTVTGYDEDTAYDEENDNFQLPDSVINWGRFTIVDKGYGAFRSWMDQGIPNSKIIKAIRMLYQSQLTDSSELFGGQNSKFFEDGMRELLGVDYLIGLDSPININWTSVAQLKRFSGSYIVGGGRNECLHEVELLMNAFNIRYRRIDSLIYG